MFTLIQLGIYQVDRINYAYHVDTLHNNIPCLSKK